MNFFLLLPTDSTKNTNLFLRISAYSAVQYFQISCTFISSCSSCSPLATTLTMSAVSHTIFVPL